MSISLRRGLTIVIFGFLLLFPASGYAEECDMERLKKIAEQVEVTTEFNQESADMGTISSNFVTVNGITDELYAMTKDMRVIFTYEDRSEDGSIKQYVDADVSDELQIFSKSCSDKPLRVINIKFKEYNEYSKSIECEGLQDKLDVCDEFYDGDLSLEEFTKAIEKYNKKDSSQATKSNFFDKYFVWIIAGVLILALLIIAFSVSRFKKNRLD